MIEPRARIARSAVEVELRCRKHMTRVNPAEEYSTNLKYGSVLVQLCIQVLKNLSMEAIDCIQEKIHVVERVINYE